MLGGRQRSESSDGQTVGQASRDLGGTKDRRRVRPVHELGVGPAVRRCTDAAGVVELRTHAATLAPAQHLGSFHEEGPALVERDLERREVHHGRVGFHLAEVRIHRRVEGQARTEPHLEVGADPAVELRLRSERVVFIHEFPAGHARV